jgi:hypothetical protein
MDANRSLRSRTSKRTVRVQVQGISGGTGRRDYSTPAHSWTCGCSADRGDHPPVAQRLVATARCTGVVLRQIPRGQCGLLHERDHHHVCDRDVHRRSSSLSILSGQLQSRHGAAPFSRARRNLRPQGALFNGRVGTASRLLVLLEAASFGRTGEHPKISDYHYCVHRLVEFFGGTFHQ